MKSIFLRKDTLRPRYIYSILQPYTSPLMETDSDLNDTSSDGRSSSPAPSLYSFNSSIDGKLLLRHVYGRILNSQNDTYFLPADWEEHRRLDLQHDIHTINLGSLYPAVEQVRRALMPRENFTPAILDVGTGSGSWAIDMALEFPHCEVVGVDLAPPRIELDLPQNCRFEIDDVGISIEALRRIFNSDGPQANLGFSHYRNSFDVVHARAVCSGIRDFPSLLNELADVLRPGGVILLGDGDMQLYDETMKPVPYSEPGQPNFSYTHRIFFAAYNAMKNRGGSIDSASMSPTWLRAIDKFTDVGWHKVYIPMGPWIYVDERSRVVAEMLRQNVYSYISTLTPLLLSEGYLAEAVETMQNEAKAELRELKVHLYSRWSYAWAVKKP